MGIRTGLLTSAGAPSPIASPKAVPDASSAQQNRIASLERHVQTLTNRDFDPDRLRTTLEWYDDFRSDTGTAFFSDPSTDAGRSSNQRILELFAAYIWESGSRQRQRKGARISANTVGAYVSTLKTAASRTFGRPVTDDSHSIRLQSMLRQYRREQPPDGTLGGERRLSRGIRARHLQLAALAGFDRTSPRGRQNWAAAILAHNLLLRGGELGRTDKGTWDPTRGLTLSSFKFQEPNRESSGCPWVLIRVVAIKDHSVRNKPTLLAVRRRAPISSQHARGTDPLDAYDAVLTAWRDRRRELNESDAKTAPFFTSASGGAWSTSDTKNLAKAIGSIAGIPREHCGAKAFRIGGATDMRQAAGTDKATHLLKERGRWASDIASIYQRPLVRQHLIASASLGDVDAHRCLEEYCEGWSQPAISY